MAASLAVLLGAVTGTAATAQTTGTTPTSPTTPTATPTPTPSPTPVPAPEATSGPAESVGLSSATFAAIVTPGGGATTFQFEYGRSNSYGLTTPVQPVPGSGAQRVTVVVGGLAANTYYHYRVVAANAGGTVRGSDVSFKTLATPRVPAVQTRTATNVQLNAVDLAARVDPRGLETKVKFEYGTSTKYGKSSATVSAGGGSGYQNIQVPVGGLAANTRYYYRVVATNSKGTARGAAHKVTTARTVTGVVLKAAPSKVVWNRYGVLAGNVAGTGTNGVSIVLIRQDFPYTEAWRQQATQTTGSGGSFSFSVGPLFSTARFQVVAKTSPSTQTSNTVTLNSLLYTKLRVLRSKRTQSRLSGLIYPAAAKARVSIQRKTPKGRWVRIKRAKVTPLKSDRTSFAASVPRLSGRTASYRAVISPQDGGKHARTTTAVVHVTKR